jgi:hypothetical protein
MAGLKRYLLFMYDDYYPGGGWHDFRGSFDTPEEAMAEALKTSSDNADLIDRETLTEVEFKYGQARHEHHQKQMEHKRLEQKFHVS